jgi:hypothetical protein
MDKQMQRLLFHQISVEKWLDKQDGRGTPLYDAPIVLPCNIIGDVKMVRNVRGEEVVSTQSIFLSGTTAGAGTIAHKDRITLPTGRRPPILSIQPYYNERGVLDTVEVNV